MKNLLKKSAVATAVAGSLMMASVASADSLLAPLVIGTNLSASNGIQTYFSFKVRGAGTVNQAWVGSSSNVHYTWFKKGTKLADLHDLSTGCAVENSTGTVSSYDMVLQPAVVPVDIFGDYYGFIDKSKPAAYAGGDFVGFAVLTDMANANNEKDVKSLANEGEMSGFAYVVDATNGFVLDYKLLNNHRSKVEGDFSAGFISKKSIDYSWLPVLDAARTTGLADTQWLTVVVGEGMTKSESTGGWKGTVKITQGASAENSIAPSIPTDTVATNNVEVGTYDNDERVWSGNKNLSVTCMGIYDRSAFLLSQQMNQTVKGGWRRAAIIADASTGANGAITYKIEEINLRNFSNGNGNVDAPEAVFGTLSGSSLVNPSLQNGLPGNTAISFQVETSGHLSASPEAHPNRPY